ncbi:hypothetical protein CAC42_2452 [Sphaceloma murrayae]|uniref:Elongator complex protein 2 n=1 Tax=Sphaceloma murrayae TaxID=2082308 RepID=A0A2K1QW34_9PEZI|nr:hypothetical protein CAC42_2452 [Sphaceloma murrayae]
MSPIEQVYIAAGGNRHPNAADWKQGILAFGSGHNVAIWRVSQHVDHGIETLLRSHTQDVNAVRVLEQTSSSHPRIVSGSSDKTIRLWSWSGGQYREAACAAHDGSVSTISVMPSDSLIAAGSSDGCIRIWSIVGECSSGDDRQIVSQKFHLLQTINLRPRFLPLATALTRLDDGTAVLAVAGTTTLVQLHVQKDGRFEYAATLPGHEGWIRALDFTRESGAAESDILLTSASQDKYIRLWRLNKGVELPSTSAAAQDPSLGILGKSLSNKPHHIGQGSSSYTVTFEALLIGSEDWIYTAQWKRSPGGPELLTTSADNSVSIWKRQADSGYWICDTRLGEISSQKGSTTATGSAGGFWIGLWSPNGDQIVSLGRTGSWRMWGWVPALRTWETQVGISGHTKEVKSIAWAPDGSYLLSTGSDQTTRLMGPWHRDGTTTWHEVARPQIHGYDLNCVDTLGRRQFISGADEKLLRVFNMPKANAELLNKLGGLDENIEDMPEIANMPVLGLSNKAITNGDTEELNGTSESNGEEAKQKLDLPSDRPPVEDHLARHTLWPEHEKLYGHGYEISAVAASPDHKLVATACRASSIDHAVIRLYETTDWREIRPPLSGHNLTVTSLAFSPDSSMLLSVGRDRQWMVYERDSPDSSVFTMTGSNPKGHSRMILDSSWARSSKGPIFATAGRDKSVKIWHREAVGSDFVCRVTIPTSVPATAVAFCEDTPDETDLLLACGTEEGEMINFRIDPRDWTVRETMSLEKSLWPAGPVNALRWRPSRNGSSATRTLAVASDDHSVRIYDVQVEG